MKPEEVTLFSHLVARPEAELDLIRAVLLIAEPEYPQLDVGAYVEELDRLGAIAAQRIASAPGRPALASVIRYLYEELGYRGNTEDYYDPRNSFLNEVIDRRTGIPISLALVLTEICQRVGIEARGVSFPGHFLVRVDIDGDALFIDPFDGRLLDRRQIAELHQRATGEEGPIDPRVLAPASKRQVLARILNNLRNIYERTGDRERLLGVLARMQVLRPDDEGRGRRNESAGGPTRGPSVN
ncbi:MAG TPA: transglutaminase-like domain-containing protein [Polyangia bacterium]|jgi:regulator of sirC expression with transglutaminase-like and TPR domain|nr:transglutaminase-like domain-containing protein [Polyangia bacterium]